MTDRRRYGGGVCAWDEMKPDKDDATMDWDGLHERLDKRVRPDDPDFRH